MEKLAAGLRLLGFPTSTYWLRPLRLNACPTTPLVKVTPPGKVPLLVPAMSLALPSPDHQLTKPEGGGVQLVRSADAVRAIMAEIIAPSRIPGVRTGLDDVIRIFILTIRACYLPIMQNEGCLSIEIQTYKTW